MLFVLGTLVGLPLVGFLIALTIHTGFKVDKTNVVGPWFKDSMFGFLVLLVIGTFILTGTSGLMALNTVNTARNLESFYYDNAILFQEATAEIKEGVEPSSREGYMFFDSARMNHISVYAGQVQEYQKNAVNYNKDLRYHRFWEKHLVFGCV